MSGPLDGTTVLDLSRVLAGPWAGQALADFGARVIKVERPGRGDDTRSWGPPYLESGENRESAYFLSANRGKESVAVDFKDPRGQAILLKLARKADILIENYKVGVAVSDLIAGLYASVGILAAYTRARETGQGEFTDLSLLDAQLATLANQASNYLVSGESPGLAGNAHPNIVPYQVFETSDNSIVVAVRNDGQFTSLCKAIAHEELATAPRFLTNSARVRNREILIPLIAASLATHSAGHWLAVLEDSGVPVSPVNTIEGAFTDPHVVARSTVTQLERADLGSVPVVRSPIRFGDQDTVPNRAPPALGDSTRAVLSEIGLSKSEIDTLLVDGVVAEPI